MGIWIKAIAINVWIKIRVDRLVGLCCLLCEIGKEYIIHRFWECMHAQCYVYLKLGTRL